MILTDIHCHILPNVDDGASDARETMAMLKKAYRDGVRRVIVTPHYRRGMFETEQERIQSLYLQVKRRAARIGSDGIELYLGCEYHRYSGMSKDLKRGLRPTLAGSKYVLVEFSGLDSYSKIRAIIYELTNAGYIPVVAHVERYPVLAEHMENVRDMIELGAKVQVNAGALLGKQGRRVKRFCKKLMKEQMVHFIGSDSHDLTVRPLLLRECADYVMKKWGKETARRIFVDNPSKIIGKR